MWPLRENYRIERGLLLFFLSAVPNLLILSASESGEKCLTFATFLALENVLIWLIPSNFNLRKIWEGFRPVVFFLPSICVKYILPFLYPHFFDSVPPLVISLSGHVNLSVFLSLYLSNHLPSIYPCIYLYVCLSSFSRTVCCPLEKQMCDEYHVFDINELNFLFVRQSCSPVGSSDQDPAELKINAYINKYQMF